MTFLPIINSSITININSKSIFIIKQMKNSILVLFLGLCLSINAQTSVIPNAGFEQWDMNIPEGWNCSNNEGIMTIFPDTDAFEGVLAAKLGVTLYEGEKLSGMLTLGLSEEGAPDLYLEKLPSYLKGQFKLNAPNGEKLLITLAASNDENPFLGFGFFEISTNFLNEEYEEFIVPISYFEEEVGAGKIGIIIGLLDEDGEFTNVSMDAYALIDDLKFDTDETTTSIQKPVNNSSNAGFKMYPNPSSGNFQIELSERNEKQLFINVYNLLGGLVAQSILDKSVGTYNCQFNGLKSGIYFIQITDDSKILFNEKMVIRQ